MPPQTEAKVSNASRTVYLLVGVVVFVVCAWLTVAAVRQISANPDHSILGVPTTIWIGTLGSISASGIFFTVSEGLRWMFDAAVTRNYDRLRFYEDTLGIKECFDQKGSEDANRDYGHAISSAKYRVWAFGISNGEFVSEHLKGLIEKKQRSPSLDVCLCFIDPLTTITLPGTQPPTTLSQVQLYDITRDQGLVSDNSSRVTNRVDYATAQIAASNVQIAVRLLSVAGYVSAMVVDDIIYVFPFTAVSKDNTRTPYLKIAVSSQIGQAFFSLFGNIKDHSLLSRPI